MKSGRTRIRGPNQIFRPTREKKSGPYNPIIISNHLIHSAASTAASLSSRGCSPPSPIHLEAQLLTQFRRFRLCWIGFFSRISKESPRVLMKSLDSVTIRRGHGYSLERLQHELRLLRPRTAPARETGRW